MQSHHPKVIELAPPGGARTRVVGRPVMKFPEFWLVPLAYALAETAGAAAEGIGAEDGATASPSFSDSSVGAGGSSIIGIGAVASSAG